MTGGRSDQGCQHSVATISYYLLTFLPKKVRFSTPGWSSSANVAISSWASWAWQEAIQGCHLRNHRFNTISLEGQQSEMSTIMPEPWTRAMRKEKWNEKRRTSFFGRNNKKKFRSFFTFFSFFQPTNGNAERRYWKNKTETKITFSFSFFS